MKDIAQQNLSLLAEYRGRGVVIGCDETGEYMVQLYWLMGGSEESQNRVLLVDGGQLFTEEADSTKPATRPELTLYNAMMEKDSRFFAVSNGRQTNNVIERADGKMRLKDLLDGWDYELDPPDWTSRITGIIDIDKWPYYELGVIRRGVEGERRLCSWWSRGHRGRGEGLTTYKGDGKPLLPFRGAPLVLPLEGNQSTILNTYWDALNTEKRIALAVKFIDRLGNSSIDIINRFQKV